MTCSSRFLSNYDNIRSGKRCSVARADVVPETGAIAPGKHVQVATLEEK